MVKTIIRLYQMTRFFRPSCCRFYPSCSDYCLQAIETRGLIAGLVLTLKRLCKCHPWHSGGIDLVPSSIVGVDCIDPRTRADAISPYEFFAGRRLFARTATGGEVQ